MLNRKVNSLVAAACLATLSISLVGCGAGSTGPATEPVSGVVTLDGAPLADAKVVFVPDGGGQAAAGSTDQAGKYVLTTFNPQDGAVLGSYKVMVTKAEAERPLGDLDLSGLSEEEATKRAMEAFYSSDASKQMYSPKGQKAAKDLIPSKYSNVVQSGLTATVNKGPNTINFELSSK